MRKPNTKRRFLFPQRAKMHIDIPECQVVTIFTNIRTVLFGVNALQQGVVSTGFMHDHVR